MKLFVCYPSCGSQYYEEICDKIVGNVSSSQTSLLYTRVLYLWQFLLPVLHFLVNMLTTITTEFTLLKLKTKNNWIHCRVIHSGILSIDSSVHQLVLIFNFNKENSVVIIVSLFTNDNNKTGNKNCQSGRTSLFTLNL